MNIAKAEVLDICVEALKKSAHIVPDGSSEFFPDINTVTLMVEATYCSERHCVMN